MKKDFSMKYIIVFLTLINLSLDCISQSTINEEENLKKYWYYRDRLKYFVSVGIEPGQSIVATERNLYDGAKLEFGQDMVLFGFYLGMLATEHELLKRNNQDVTNTLYELQCALLAFKRLDECESKAPYYLSEDKFDGFFRRDDVPIDFIVNHPELNDGLESTDIINWESICHEGVLYWEPGKPAFVDKIGSTESYEDDGSLPKYEWTTMSQDEAIGVLNGLALVSKFFPSESSWYGNLARTMAGNIVNYIRNENGLGLSRWHIYDPNGNKIDNDHGGNANAYAYGFAKAAQAITGKPLSDFYDYSLDYCRELIWHELQLANNFDFESGGPMVATLAAIGDSWRLVMFPIVTPINTTREGLNLVTSSQDWDSYYLLLWKILHDKDADIDMTKAFNQLTSAPCNGPYSYYVEFVSPEWAVYQKFWQGKDRQQNGRFTMEVDPDGCFAKDFTGNFSGLDYMLLYNLYHLANEGNLPDYVNYMDRKVAGTVPIETDFGVNIIWGSEEHPINVMAFNTIESSMKINAQTQTGTEMPGNVTYRAGKEIILTDGFEANAGATFTAYIEPFACPSITWNNFKSQDTTSETILYAEMINAYDSAISVPYSGIYYDDYYENIADYNFKNMSLTSDSIVEEVNQELSVSLYPNPNNGNFVLQINHLGNNTGRIKVISTLGNTVYNSVVDNEKSIIDLSSQSIGIYIVKVEIENYMFIERVIIQ